MLPLEKRIRTKKDLKDWLKYEKERYKLKNVGIIKSLSFALFGSSFESVILYKHQKLLRKTEYYYNTNKKIRFLLSILKLKKYQNKYALHIAINCCGRGLRIMHVGPILVNDKASIGENLSLHICTAIAAGGRINKAPTIGNNCVIGFGATILSDVTIADGVAIGANAVVNKDVLEPNIAVAGVPAKKISNNGRDTWNKN